MLDLVRPIARKVEAQVVAAIPRDCIGQFRTGLNGIVNASPVRDGL